MKFPIDLSATFHKHGGRITRITGIEHEEGKTTSGRSTDVWHFVGDVEWRDGTKSRALQIAPYAVCYDDESARAEVDALMKAMSEYLHANGEWCDRASKHEGWYAHRAAKPTKRVRRSA